MSSSTSTSKRWLLFYLGALILTAGVGWIYAARFEPETQFWTTVFKQRRAEMAKRSDEPHVIFTGDSACAFGIDPKTFTKVTSVPSFNLGGTRQMGMKIFMEEALSQAQEGDTLVLLCNPKLLVDSLHNPDTKAGLQMAAALPTKTDFAGTLNASRPGFNHLITLGAKLALRRPAFVYDMDGYQEKGRVSTKEITHPPGNQELFKMAETETLEAVSVLRQWNDRCLKIGVKFAYLMPLEFTSEEILEENRQRKSAFRKQLQTSFLPEKSQVLILKTPAHACSAEDEFFADTLFHLTEEGSKNFTREVARTILNPS